MKRFYSTNIPSNFIYLENEEAQHCTKVLRGRLGDVVEVLNGNGILYEDVEGESAETLDSKEQFALDYLQKNEFLLPKEYARRLNISLQRANVMLVKLTKLGLILHNKDGRGDYYMLR